MKPLLLMFFLACLLLSSCTSLPNLAGKDCTQVPQQYQDLCCSQNNKGTIHIQCEGSWKYKAEGCGFECKVEIIA
ncbi:hypothetical protein HZB02_04525 [Candidatus Woesearchaeota archaeon]|nr:hypothetical protein [Candidatus Woesearchaeota archaeon]